MHSENVNEFFMSFLVTLEEVPVKSKKKKVKIAKNVKSKCCKKYKKGEGKRCKRCPCFDLLKKAC